MVMYELGLYDPDLVGGGGCKRKKLNQLVSAFNTPTSPLTQST
jgi:hypothetical protein